MNTLNDNQPNNWEQIEQLLREQDRRVEALAQEHRQEFVPPLPGRKPAHAPRPFWRFAAAAATVTAIFGSAIWLTIARPAEGTLGVPASGNFPKVSVAEYPGLSYIRCNSQCDAQYIADETHQVL